MPEDVTLKGTMTDEISLALGRIEQRLSDVEGRLSKVGAAGRVMGDGVDSGAGKATRAIDKAGRAADGASPKIKKAGDEAEKAGLKAGLGSKGFSDFANKVEKAGKKSSDFGAITKVFRFAAIATGIYAAVGAVSALGAGSVIGVAHLAPLLLNLLNLAPAGLAAAASMATIKLAFGDVSKALTVLNNPMSSPAQIANALWGLSPAARQVALDISQTQRAFKGLATQVGSGGLYRGVSLLMIALRGLTGVTGTGLANIGADIGYAAGQLALFLKQGTTLTSIAQIFTMLRPIIQHGLDALIVMLPAILALIKAILPVTDRMATSFGNVAGIFSAWVQTQAATGNITLWLTNAWHGLHTAGSAVWNIVVALFNIFHLAFQATSNLGGGVLDLTRRFRDWTASASGSASIAKYFADAVPTVRMLGTILMTVLGMIIHVASGANIGPLLSLINSQLLPALGALLNHLTEVGGLGPGLITLLTNVATILANVSFGGFGLLAASLVTISNWIVWLQKNVPGANFIISALLTSFLGFKLVDPVLQGVGGALKILSKIPAMLAALSSATETMGIVSLIAMDEMATGATAAGAAFDAAFVSSPIGWIVLAIIAVIAIIVILWMKCAWFRDAVKAVWNAIKIAAVAVWRALEIAWDATVKALIIAAKAVASFFVMIWRTTVAIVMAIWKVLLAAWKIIWIIVSTYVRIYINVVKFIIQTVVYIIVAIITLIAIIAELVWKGIAAGALALWNGLLHPLFVGIGIVVTAVWNAIAFAAQWCWNLIVAGAQWLWNTILSPIFSLIAIGAKFVWSGLSSAAQWCWNLIVAGAQWLWNTILHPIFTVVGSVGSAIWGGIVTAAKWAWDGIKSVWNGIADFFSGLWDGIEKRAKMIWKGLGDIIGGVGDIVSGVWNTIVNAVKAVWNFIAKGWNSIPDITVPDWVPLIGGHTFGLPKLPVLYAGGPTPGGPAVVGEHGPELLVRGNQITQILGARGPEVAQLPAGGYVVPNFRTLAAGLARPLPASVAATIASAGERHMPATTPDRELAKAIRALTSAVRDQRPPIVVPPGSGKVRDEVLAALRDRDREDRARDQYSYTAGKG